MTELASGIGTFGWLFERAGGRKAAAARGSQQSAAAHRASERAGGRPAAAARGSQQSASARSELTFLSHCVEIRANSLDWLEFSRRAIDRYSDLTLQSAAAVLFTKSTTLYLLASSVHSKHIKHVSNISVYRLLGL